MHLLSAKLEMRALRACVRPVVFGTGLADFPLSTAGTAFLLSSLQKTFVLTAKHVVRGYRVERLRIYPSPNSRRHLRIAEYYNVDAERPGEEVEDFIVIEVENALSSAKDLVTLGPSPEAWQEFRCAAQYFLIGYPEPKSHVDYKASVIHSGQVLMAGRYSGPSVSPHCHELSVENPHSLPTFSGFSGGPVFSLRQRVAMPSVLTFCGMALQGTPASGLVRFLDCAAIHSAIEQVHVPRSLRRARWDA